jgi:hypothetical protein
MNKNIKIPDGWFRLLAGTTLKEDDKFWSVGYWSLTGDSGRVIVPVDFVYIRECESKTEGIFDIGDEVIVNNQHKGVIISPRFDLTNGYGYVVQFNKVYTISNWDFTGLICGSPSTGTSSIPFYAKFIKLVPKVKEIKLNDNYTAQVYKDKVVVGCQTFNKDAIDKIVEAQSELI